LKQRFRQAEPKRRKQRERGTAYHQAQPMFFREAGGLPQPQVISHIEFNHNK
jgi:hypothetical protein